jgi:hypothetical protein
MPLAAEPAVKRRNGQWEVDIVVVFEDRVVRKMVDGSMNERRARPGARWIERAARRDVAGPLDG